MKYSTIDSLILVAARCPEALDYHDTLAVKAIAGAWIALTNPTDEKLNRLGVAAAVMAIDYPPEVIHALAAVLWQADTKRNMDHAKRDMTV